MQFIYVIDETEDHETLDTNYSIQNDPGETERISVSVDSDGQVQITANRDGWVYLAKVCLEMSVLASKDPDFHSHRTNSFQVSNETEQDAVTLSQLE